jgi:hypothetical protein
MGSTNKTQTTPPVARFTVIGLFEDTLDMEKALVALRRARRASEEISVVLRDLSAEHDGKAGSAVSRAVSDHSLDAVGGWLVGLAELVLPDAGTYLVAGPIGVAVAEIPSRPLAPKRSVKPHEHDDGEIIQPLAVTLAFFGFSPEESHYLAHRLGAGDAIVGHTTSEAETLHATRRLFADCDAVHIGQSQTDEAAFREVQRQLTKPTKPASRDVVVADAVDPFINLCEQERPPRWVKSLCGSRIVDNEGTEVGEVAGLLALPIDEPNDEKLLQSVRYVVVRYGRVLKLGRKRVAVPKDIVDLDQKPPAIHAPVAVVHRSPAYDPESPFSRREEEAIFDHFGAEPYWKSRRATKAATA